jgi:hypothetical protein
VSAREAAINNFAAVAAATGAITTSNSNTTTLNNSLDVDDQTGTTKNSASTPNLTSKQQSQRINKPILMCFICKLSFGNTKSFTLHSNNEHGLNLHESEKLLLNRELSSAIIQRNDDEKPQISFLEPLDITRQQQSGVQENSMTGKTTTMTNIKSETVPMPQNTTHKTKTSPFLNSNSNMNKISDENMTDFSQLHEKNHITSETSQQITKQLMSCGSPSNTSAAAAAASKLFNELLQQQQHQQSHYHQMLRCADHQDIKVAVDCKNCEMLQIQLHLNKSPAKSPNGGSNSSSSGSSMTSPTSMMGFGGINAMSGGSLTAMSNAVCGNGSQNISPSASSFTIGACPDHINGRPIGVECAR